MADPFPEALAHHRAGRLDLAAMLYRAILDEQPDHADSLNLLGVVSHQRGDDVQAVKLIERAIELFPARPPYHVNLAAAYRALGRFDDAIAACHTALRLQPDQPEAYLNLGLAQKEARQFPEAAEAFRWVVEHRPQDIRGPQLLADCLCRLGQTHEAIAVYRAALVQHADAASLHLALGTLLLAQEDARGAEAHLRRAASSLPGSVEARINLGSCLVQLGREREALPVYEEALRLAPNNPSLCVNVGQAWLGCGEYEIAENWFQAVLKTNPNHVGALCGRADLCREAGRLEESLPLYEQAQRLEPACDAYKGWSESLWELGEVERAIGILRGAVERDPGATEARVRLGTMLVSAGDIDGGKASFHAALRLMPDHLYALSELANVVGAKLPDADREILERAVELPVPELQRASLHFGLAKVYDGRNDFTRAAEHTRRGNALKMAYHEARKRGYNHSQHCRFVGKIIEVFTPELFAKTRGFGLADERPVFVVGVPRSGTTLVEQILASHPLVHGAGERWYSMRALTRLPQELGLSLDPLLCFPQVTADAIRHCAEWHLAQLRQLDGGKALRIVDKMPDNYPLLGWLALMFPKARFIHCRRDLRDTALSCWMTNFMKIRWADDLENIALRIEEYQRLMAHWRNALPVPMLEVDYERLVADQEGESRRLIAWLGLEWDAACLEFYRTKRYVQTASATQVREPIYSRSIGRWKQYEESLAPFLRRLGL